MVAPVAANEMFMVELALWLQSWCKRNKSAEQMGVTSWYPVASYFPDAPSDVTYKAMDLAIKAIT